MEFGKAGIDGGSVSVRTIVRSMQKERRVRGKEINAGADAAEGSGVVNGDRREDLVINTSRMAEPLVNINTSTAA
ncbi:unnamed protein product [Toxocara canis]|uniref:Uncharacterized protein n=1 Tax=Toxocara canis TaxID=6265 RepID=A0A183TX05_TOXCA|nr:unnamed protein product [Toxocara canis]